jgi:hypothetical protein
MDSTIIAAIIGAAATVGASIATFVLTRLFDNIPLPPKNARQSSLIGRWEGTIHWEGGQGAPCDMQFSLDVKSIRRTIRAEGKWWFTSQNQGNIQDVIMTGIFMHDRFLKLEYKRVDRPGEINFGIVLLELSLDGQTIDGHFVGFAAFSKGMIWGTTHGYKQKANP